MNDSFDVFVTLTETCAALVTVGNACGSLAPQASSVQIMVYYHITKYKYVLVKTKQQTIS